MRPTVPLAAALAALATAAIAPAADGREVLAPGVVYERQVRPGPVIAHVVRATRYPDRRGAAARPRMDVRAVAGRPFATGRTPLSAMVRRHLPAGALAGLNGDYFSWSGVPSGLLLDAAGLGRDPAASRSSAVFDAAGTLHVARLALEGAYRAGTATGRVHAINRLPREDRPEAILYDHRFGPRTPPLREGVSVLLERTGPGPLIGTVEARVVAVGSGGVVSTSGGRIVLVEHHPGRAAALAGLRRGEAVTLDLGVPGLPEAARAGIGGGPLLVRDGVPAVAPEGFTLSQTAARTARSAVGQRADGTVLMVSVEDRRSGPSRGVTAAELGRLMAGLGARTAMGLDSGGSAGISLRGAAPPTAGPEGERPIATALVLAYRGVQLNVPRPQRLSPNGDGVAERGGVRFRITDRSAVRVELLDRRNRRVEGMGAGWRRPGVHAVRVPGGLPDGRYRVRVTARAEDEGAATRMTRNLVVDRTLGHLRLGGREGAAVVAFRLARGARVSVIVRGADGRARRAVAGRRLGPGGHGLRVAARPGVAEVRVLATGRLGTSELSGRVRIRR